MIIEDTTSEATAAEVQQVLDVASQQLQELEQQQAAGIRLRRWSDAKALSATIAMARAWLDDLKRHRDDIQNEHTQRAAAPVEEWERAGVLVRADYTNAPAPRAEVAHRALVSFLSDAFAATGEKRFHPAGAPLFTLPRARRNPLEQRPPVDKSHWAHLLS